MPIYEYLCLDCRRRFTHLVLGASDREPLRCAFCSSERLRRLMSRFSALSSEENRLESLADPSTWGGLDESDPKSVARFVKKMGSELGEEIDRDELDQMADEAAREAESGETPLSPDTDED